MIAVSYNNKQFMRKYLLLLFHTNDYLLKCLWVLIKDNWGRKEMQFDNFTSKKKKSTVHCKKLKKKA